MLNSATAKVAPEMRGASNSANGARFVAGISRTMLGIHLVAQSERSVPRGTLSRIDFTAQEQILASVDRSEYDRHMRRGLAIIEDGRASHWRMSK